jgi:hypothetical protein
MEPGTEANYLTEREVRALGWDMTPSERGETESSLVFARRRLAENGDRNLFPVVREMNAAGYRRSNGQEWTADALNKELAASRPTASTPEPTDTPAALGKVHECFQSRLYLPDPGVVDVALGTYVAHRLGGDPVWTLLVGPPGSGKTETLMALRGLPGVHLVSSLTAQTFASGLKGKRQASLLLRMEDDGKDFLLLKDFTTVLTMHRESRQEILAQLREIYDGSYSKEFGTGERISWDGRIGFIAGVTPVIDNHHVVNALLGERFIYHRLLTPDRRKMAVRALKARGQEREMREELQAAVAEFIEPIDFSSPMALSEATEDQVVALADFTTRARSGVDRDSYQRDITAVPVPEAPTRFLKQIGSLAVALKVMGYSETDAMRRVAGVAQESIPPTRLNTLRLLRQTAGMMDTQEIADEIGLATSSTRRVLEDLTALELTGREAGPGGRDGSHKWWLTDESRETWEAAESSTSRVDAR